MHSINNCKIWKIQFDITPFCLKKLSSFWRIVFLYLCIIMFLIKNCIHNHSTILSSNLLYYLSLRFQIQVFLMEYSATRYPMERISLWGGNPENTEYWTLYRSPEFFPQDHLGNASCTSFYLFFSSTFLFTMAGTLLSTGVWCFLVRLPMIHLAPGPSRIIVYLSGYTFAAGALTLPASCILYREHNVIRGRRTLLPVRSFAVITNHITIAQPTDAIKRN